MSEPTSDLIIALSSGQMALKIRYKELRRALFSPLLSSWPTFVLMREVAHANGGWATLAVTTVGFAAAIVGFGARSFGAKRADRFAFKFVVAAAVIAALFTAATTGNPEAALVVGGMMVAVGILAARYVASVALHEFERETLQAIRRGDLKITRIYFGERVAPRIRIVDPPLRWPVNEP
jgi:hypothetical protein